MIRIRGFKNEDLRALHAINQAGVPGVSSETPEDLAKWISLAETFVAVSDVGSPTGFLTLIKPGTADYPSPNLRWFEARGGNVIYVDRIAISAEARGQGVGEALYQRCLRRVG